MSDDAALDFKCDDCGRLFPSQPALNGHLLSHRPEVACPECGKSYKSSGALGNHRMREHGVMPQGEKAVAKRRAKVTYDADDIVASVLHVLWPGGSVPVTAIVPLFQWREDTKRFLEEVQT